MSLPARSCTVKCLTDRMIASFAGEDNHSCDVGSEGDANVQRNIFELDAGARVAMNRLRLAFCSRASELAIYGGLTHDAYCGRRRRSDLVPFFLEGAGG